MIYTCLIYYTDKRPDMKQLLQLMRDKAISAKWFELGAELFEKDTALTAIQADYPNDVNRCCREMFKKWLDVNPDASWSQLVTALNKIGMAAAADVVSKQYISGN